jgi:hypothetical protein
VQTPLINEQLLYKSLAPFIVLRGSISDSDFRFLKLRVALGKLCMMEMMIRESGKAGFKPLEANEVKNSPTC